MEKSRMIARKLTRNAFKALEVFEGRAGALEALADYLLRRNS
jgi:geranylgeranyl pyrophosphate synthase